MKVFFVLSLVLGAIYASGVIYRGNAKHPGKFVFDLNFQNSKMEIFQIFQINVITKTEIKL